MQTKTAGIVMECNPLHEGHAYLIRKAREECGHVIVVMSGDFVQRGIPAIESKEKRTADILKAGADLVFELPVPYATGGAGYFAKGAVTLLLGLHSITDLYFGSESGDLASLQRAAAYLEKEESPSFREELKAGLARGMTYPAARTLAAKSDGVSLPSSPNDLLSIEYLSFLSGSGITLHAVPRITAKSASSIRKARTLQDRTLPTARSFSGQLLTALIETAGTYENYLDISEDLSNRIFNLLPQYRNPEDFALLLKTKDLTYTRVCRALCHILLGIRKDEFCLWQKEGIIGYARLLGRRKSARDLLSEVRRRASFPLVISPAKDRSAIAAPFQSMLELDKNAAFLYDLTAAGLKKSASPVPRDEEKRLIISDL